METEEIRKLAAGEGTLQPVPMNGTLAKAIQNKTAEQIADEAETAAQKQAKAEIDALPFAFAPMKEASRVQFERRAPEWIKNAEARVRLMAVMGEDYCGFKAHEKGERPSRYQQLLVDHFVGLGFAVNITPVGFDVELV